MVTVFDGELTVRFSFSFAEPEQESVQPSFEEKIIDRFFFSEDKQAYYIEDIEEFISEWNKSIFESIGDPDFTETTEFLRYEQVSNEPTYTVAPTYDFYDFLRDSDPRWVASMQEDEFEKLGFLNADGRPVEEIADHILRYASPEVKRGEIITALTAEKGRREKFPLLEVRGFQQGIVKKERFVRAEKMLPPQEQGMAR